MSDIQQINLKEEQNQYDNKSNVRKRIIRLHSQISKEKSYSQRRNSSDQKSLKRIRLQLSTGKMRSRKTRLIQTKKSQIIQDQQKYRNLKQLKWIPIANAYVPKKLKNMMVDKLQFQMFFQKHDPNSDSLGQIYMESVISHFNEWKNKISRKYIKIIDKFLKGTSEKTFQGIKQQLKQIQILTTEMKQKVKATYQKSPNEKILHLLQYFEQSLQNASKIFDIINNIHESKSKVQNIMFKLEGKTLIKQMLNNLKNQQLQQVRQSRRNGFKKFEEDIFNRIYSGISHIYNISIDTATKLNNMKNIIDRIKSALNNRNENIGFKGITFMNEIFTEILQQSRLFKEVTLQLEKNTFFSKEFKNKIKQYEKQMAKSREIAIMSIFNMVNSMLSSMIFTFQQYYSISQALKRETENFLSFRKQLKNIGKNLDKQQFKQGKIILKFVNSLTTNLEILTDNISALKYIKCVQAYEKYIDQSNYIQFINKITSLTKKYKQNIRELIKKFICIKNQLNNKQKEINNRDIQYLVEENGIEQTNSELAILEKLQSLSLSFKQLNIQEHPLFKESHLSLFNADSILNNANQIENLQICLKKVSKNFSQIKNLENNEFIIRIFKQIKFKSNMINKIQTINSFLEASHQLNKKNAVAKFSQIFTTFQKSNDKQYLHKFIQNVMMIELYNIVQPQRIQYLKLNIEKSLIENKDYSIDLLQLLEKRNIFLNILNSIKNEANQQSLIKQQLNKIIESINVLQQKIEIKESINLKMKKQLINLRMIKELLDQIFSCLFLDTQSYGRIIQIIQRFLKILRSQICNIELIKNGTRYQSMIINNEIEIKLQTFHNFIDQLKQFMHNKNKYMLGNFTIPYTNLLNQIMMFLKVTNQQFFCILSSKNEPIYIGQSSSHNSFIMKFLKSLNMQNQKQFFNRIKSEYYIYDYNVSQQESPKLKKENERKNSSYKSQRSYVTNNTQKTAQAQIKLFLQQSINDEQDNDEQIDENNLIEEQIKTQINNYHKKISSRTDQDNKTRRKSPRKIKGKIIKQIKIQTQTISNYIKIPYIVSIERLYQSINKLKKIRTLEKNKINRQLYISFANKVFIYFIVNKSLRVNFDTHQERVYEQIVNMRNELESSLSDNIFYQVIIGKGQIPKLLNYLTSLEEVFNQDNFTDETVFYTLTKNIADFLRIFNVQFDVVCNAKNNILFFSQPGQLFTSLMPKLLQNVNLGFNQQETKDITDYYFKKLNNGVYLLSHEEEFNYEKNNETLKEIEEKLMTNDLSTLYQFKQLEGLYSAMWSCVADKSEENMKRLKNAQRKFIDEIKKVHEQTFYKQFKNTNTCLLQYKRDLQDRIKHFTESLRKNQGNITISIQGEVTPDIIAGVTEKLITCTLWTQKLILFEEQCTKMPFYVKSVESKTTDLQIIKRLASIMLPKLNIQLDSIVKIENKKGKRSINLTSIFNNLKTQMNSSIKLHKQIAFDILSIINQKYLFDKQNIQVSQYIKAYSSQVLQLSYLLQYCNKLNSENFINIKSKIQKMIIIRQIIISILKTIAGIKTNQNKTYITSIVKLQKLSNIVKNKYSVFEDEYHQLILVLPGQFAQESIRKFIQLLWNINNQEFCKLIKSTEKIQNSNNVYKIQRKYFKKTNQQINQEIVNFYKQKQQQIKRKQYQQYCKKIENIKKAELQQLARIDTDILELSRLEEKKIQLQNHINQLIQNLNLRTSSSLKSQVNQSRFNTNQSFLHNAEQ